MGAGLEPSHAIDIMELSPWHALLALVVVGCALLLLRATLKGGARIGTILRRMRAEALAADDRAEAHDDGR